MRTAKYRTMTTDTRPKMLDIQQSMAEYSMGRASLMRTAKEANALFYCGRKPLVIAEKMDRYINTMAIGE